MIAGRVVNQDGVGMGGVYVYLATPEANNVYEPNDPAYVPGEPYVVTNAAGDFEFTGLSVANPPGNNYTISELVPAGYVAQFPYGNQYAVNVTFSTTTGLTYVSNFLDINSVATTVTQDGGTYNIVFKNEPGGPADPAGAVGPNDIIQADNNNFIVYNKISGTVEESMTLDQFWLAAWNQEAEDGDGSGFDDVLFNAYEPQVVYDSASGRWYVTALDDSNPPLHALRGDHSALCRPTTSCWPSPRIPILLDGWVEFVIPADEDLFGLNPDPLALSPNVPDHRPLRADSDTLGFNAALNSTALVHHRQPVR